MTVPFFTLRSAQDDSLFKESLTRHRHEGPRRLPLHRRPAVDGYVWSLLASCLKSKGTAPGRLVSGSNDTRFDTMGVGLG